MDTGVSPRACRALLRLLRRPSALERSPLGVRLKRVLGAATVRAAILHVVEQDLGRGSSRHEMLKQVIRRCDLDGMDCRSVAGELNFSLRHFFRFRSEAMLLMVEAIKRRLDVPASDTACIEDLSRLVSDFDPRLALSMSKTALCQIQNDEPVAESDVLALPVHARVTALALMAYQHELNGRFSAAERCLKRAEHLKTFVPEASDDVGLVLAQVAVLRARRQPTAERFKAAENALESICGPRRTLALCYLAELYVRTGRLTEATRLLNEAYLHAHETQNIRELLAISTVRAGLALLAGDYAEARALAAAAIALDRVGGPSLADALVAHGTAALHLRAPWQQKHDKAIVERFPLIAVVKAQHLFAAGKEGEGKRLAEAALKRAEELRDEPAICRARAALGYQERLAG